MSYERWCPNCDTVELSWGKCPKCKYVTEARMEQDTKPRKWHRPVSVHAGWGGARTRKPKLVRFVETQDGRPLVCEYRCPTCKGRNHNCELCNGRGTVSRLRLGMHQGWITRTSRAS